MKAGMHDPRPFVEELEELQSIQPDEERFS
jgi:hypothetical protein